MVTSQILPPQPEWLHPEHKERKEIHGWIVDQEASLFVVAPPRKELRLEAYKLKVPPLLLPPSRQCHLTSAHICCTSRRLCVP
jgi:hypothetical protein